MTQDIQKQITNAVMRSGRKDGDVSLIAVSKQQPDDRIETALTTGFRIFGENRVQEAQARWQHRRPHYPDLRLHLIGPLQSNKASDAVALFDVIHTVDREKIASKLSHEMTVKGRALPCYIQVNTGDEPQKAGISPAELEAFFSFTVQDLGLNIIGLMCIPPIDEEPAMHFGLLASYASRLGLPRLSMGMSGDFETAISFGATDIRLGSALFGERLPRR